MLETQHFQKCAYILLNLLFLGLFSLIPGNCLAEQSTFSSAPYAFSLRYPNDEFERIEAKSPGLGLALRSRNPAPTGAFFPTMTVTIEPKLLQNPRDLTKHEGDVVSSYHKIGIPSANVRESRTISTQPGLSVHILLDYLQDETSFASSVTLIPAQEFTYVLTFIDYKSSYTEHLALEKQIVESFETKEARPLPTKILNFERDRQIVLLCLLLVLGAVAGGVVYAWKHYRASGSHTTHG